MPLLFYWRPDNYRRDLDLGAGYHLNQANPLLHEIEAGDSLWAFTRASTGGYALAAQLVVRAKTTNPPNYRYGRYRVWGDLRLSRYFRVDGQPNLEWVLRNLSCRPDAAVLGHAFQGRAAVRRTTAEDHRILCAAARNLALEPRARILPEERLEAALLADDAARVASLVRQEAHGIAEARAEYLYRQAPARSKNLALYDGRCQVCAWDPHQVYAEELCHAHHLQWLSRGGEDELANMALVCPNHHAAIHRCDAPFDFHERAFLFPDHSEPLALNRHLAG